MGEQGKCIKKKEEYTLFCRPTIDPPTHARRVSGAKTPAQKAAWGTPAPGSGWRECTGAGKGTCLAMPYSRPLRASSSGLARVLFSAASRLLRALRRRSRGLRRCPRKTTSIGFLAPRDAALAMKTRAPFLPGSPTPEGDCGCGPPPSLPSEPMRPPTTAGAGTEPPAGGPFPTRRPNRPWAATRWA